MKAINVSNKIIGKIKELHGVNCAPYLKTYGNKQPLIYKTFEYAGVPRSRLHDCCGSYGGAYFVDIPNIFRDFDADENNPENYDFYYTDEYIGAIIASGAKIVYRLGITVEWGSKKYRTYPPKDYAKWAKICENVIRHYNEGWANGFNYGIEYWEIWNEPENPPMWSGTKQEFFELYKVASLHLKKRFPKVKIGGYGSCGFYAAFRENMSDFYKGFLTWFDEFLSFCKENNCPLDFYTWHIYTDKVSEIICSAEHARKKLDEYGFNNTESHLNEWNYGAEGGGFTHKATNVGASFCLDALIAMQNNSVDLAQYYVLSPLSSYNGWLDLRTNKFTSVIDVFAAFSRLYRAENQVDVVTTRDAPNVIAAKAKDGATYALITTYQKEEERIKVSFDGVKTFGVYELMDDSGFKKLFKVDGTGIEFTVKSNAVYLIAADTDLKDDILDRTKYQ